MRVGIVINPISGRRGRRSGEAARRCAFAESRAAALGADATVVLTERRGHARELAQTLVDEGCETVIAMGGDGTVNEVAQALVGTSTVLGIVPCGSGDGLALGLGVPADPERAMRTALLSEERRIDVGDAGGRMFLNILGIGFDAKVAQAFADRSTRGLPGYLAIGLRLVWSYDSSEYHVTWQTNGHAEERRGRRFLLGFANGPAYGNGAVLAPDANVSDGRLDLLLVDAGAPLQQLWRARRLFWRCRDSAAGLERARVTHATVSGSAMVCHLDGEVFETAGTLEIGVRPLALRVRS